MTSQADDPVRFYLNDLAKVTPLTKDEENALFEKLRRGDDPDEAAERRLIEGRLALVVEIAERYASSGMSMLELIQEGNRGLLKAVPSFAANPTGDFRTYASALIDAAVREAVAKWKQSGRG
jgi:RNA polymerase primary sigma factor